MYWYLKVLKQYADFNGRARRKEYWMFLLFNIIFAIAAAILDNVLGLTRHGLPYGTFYILYAIAVFIPGLAVNVRRLHDTGKSGWMILIVFIPLIGAIWLLVLLVTDGQAGVNEYGPNPKEEITGNSNNNNLNQNEMNNTVNENEFSKGGGGTVSNDNFSAGFGTSRKKTLIEGQEEITLKENPKNLNVLAGFLVSFSKTEIGEYWELREGNNAIGSSQENNILLSEKHVSGKHANLNVSRDAENNCWKFQIVDLSATNGTFVNERRLPIYSGVDIKNNDTLKIGEYILMLFVADKFTNKLSRSEKFQGTIQENTADDYTGRDWNSSGNNATNAG